MRRLQDQILDEIEAFLKETGMAPTTFGRRTLNSAGFVADLTEDCRTGRPRRLRCDTVDHLRQWMSDYRDRVASHE